MLSNSPRWAIAVLAVAGCSGSSPSLQEASNLEAQGNFEQAAQKFEVVCTEVPNSPECAQAGQRATKALVTAAATAMSKNQYVKAEGLLLRALVSASDAMAQEITTSLGKPELTDGLRYEYAATDPDKKRAAATMKSLAESESPLAKQAKAWFDKENPALLVAEAKAACGPEHEGSCWKAFEALDALTDKPAGYDEVKAAYEAEQKRTEKTRGELERFLAVFASRGKKDLAVAKCITDKQAQEPNLSVVAPACDEEVYADNKAPWERYDAEQTEENLFRRRAALLKDEGLSDWYFDRKKAAFATGEVPKAAAKPAAGGAK